ncbi:peptidylprolyl isomerase [Candidatus Uhrbacteria bacterium]|nr:peptidylprolyl isomerase [Candidatus Uhrbacteria bacterium]
MLLGAGCSQPAQEASEITFTYPDTVAEETPEVLWTFPGTLPDEQIAGKQIRITTEKGDIVFELFEDTAPMTVSNFVYLTTGGYYDGLAFHRREEGFVIQGGDPNGDGTGGPGYDFADELDDAYAYERGIVAMANRGPDTNGSQFFIMLDDTPLPKAYTIFGRVTEGLDVVDEIVVGDVMGRVTVEDRQP